MIDLPLILTWTDFFALALIAGGLITLVVNFLRWYNRPRLRKGWNLDKVPPSPIPADPSDSEKLRQRILFRLGLRHDMQKFSWDEAVQAPKIPRTSTFSQAQARLGAGKILVVDFQYGGFLFSFVVSHGADYYRLQSLMADNCCIETLSFHAVEA